MKPYEYAQVHSEPPPEKSLLVEAGSPTFDLQWDDQCLRYSIRLESSPEYVEGLNVLDNQ